MEGFLLPGTPDEMEHLAGLREAVCKACPLYKKKYGIIPICNNKLYLNPSTNDVSVEPKEGYKRGCGCSIEYRVHNPNVHCVCGKW